MGHSAALWVYLFDAGSHRLFVLLDVMSAQLESRRYAH